MSCETDHITIMQGEDRGDERPIKLKIRKNNGDDPFPLITPDTSEIIVKFIREDQETAKCIEKKLTDTDVVILDEAGGIIQVKLSAADTLLLKIEDDQDFTAEITQNAEIAKVVFKEKLTVLEDPCL